MIQFVVNKNGLTFALYDLSLNQELLDSAGLKSKEFGDVFHVSYALFEEDDQLFLDDTENTFPLDKIICNNEATDIIEFIKNLNDKEYYLISSQGSMYKVICNETDIDFDVLRKNDIVVAENFDDMITQAAKLANVTEEEACDMIKTNIRKLNVGWIAYDSETMDDFESASENLISKIK